MGQEDQEFRAVLGYRNPTKQQQKAPQEIQTRVLGSVNVPRWETRRCFPEDGEGGRGCEGAHPQTWMCLVILSDRVEGGTRV